MERTPHRRWRYYKTAQGGSPVEEFLDGLTDDDAAEVIAAMKHVASAGERASRHLCQDIWEVRVSGANRTYRVLYSPEGKRGQVLLALEAFAKKTQKTPPRIIGLATTRLEDWRKRGR